MTSWTPWTPWNFMESMEVYGFQNFAWNTWKSMESMADSIFRGDGKRIVSRDRWYNYILASPFLVRSLGCPFLNQFLGSEPSS